MSSLCGVGVRIRVCVNNFFSKTTRPRDVLFFLKDTLSIEDEKLFKVCKSVSSSVFTLKENMEVVRRTFNSKSVKVRTKTNKSKVDLFTV